MIEFEKINWRENPLEEDNEFLSPTHIQESYVFQYINGNFDPNTIQTIKQPQFNNYNEDADNKIIPGYEYYFKKTQLSCFNRETHAKVIVALKNIEQGKTKLDMQEKACLELYNTLKPRIQEENAKFLKVAERHFNKTPFSCQKYVKEYGKKLRLRNLQRVMNYPQFYKKIDLLSFTSCEEEEEFEMTHIANILEAGRVSKFCPNPLLERFFFQNKDLPPLEQLYTSNLSVSEDANIDSILKNNRLNVIISMSSLKTLVDFTTIQQFWHIPLVVKEITLNDGCKQICVFLDKPFAKLNENNFDFMERSCKRMIKRSFCCCDGLKFDNNIESLTLNESKKTKKYNNATYKLWNLQAKEANNILMKHQLDHQVIKVLIRCKIDGCELIKSGNLQAVSVAPKIECQADYGAAICTKSELARQWATLFFRPFSTLYRVRVHPNKNEVLKIENCSLHKVLNEANLYYQYKPQLAIGILYKIFHYLMRLSPGKYLLRHEPKQGAFFTVLQEESQEDLMDLFDLHKTYASEARIVEDYKRPWTPIDTHLILPAFECMQHMPAMFHPKPVQKLGALKKYRKRKKSKANVVRKNKVKK